MKYEYDSNNPPAIPAIFFGEGKEKDLILKEIEASNLSELDKRLIIKIFRGVESFANLIKKPDKALLK